MPQDPFDSWLRSTVDPDGPVPGADQEWAKIQGRLRNDQKNRRGLLWWWSGLGLVLLLVLAFFVLPIHTENQSHISSSNDVVQQEDSGFLHKKIVDQSTEKSQIENNPSVQTNVENNKTNEFGERAESGYFNQQESRTSGELKNPNSASIKNKRIFEEKNTQLEEDRINKSHMDLLHNTTKNVQRKKPSVVVPMATLPLKALQWNNDINTMSDREGQEPMLRKGNSPKWQLQLGTFGGWSSLVFSGAQPDWRNQVSNYENAREQWGVEAIVWRKLSPHWSIGGGIGYRNTHRELSQNIVDTMSSTDVDQVTDVLEDLDGRITTYTGPGTGKTIVNIDRSLHMAFHELRLPFGIRYEQMLTDRWIAYGGLMMIPGVYFDRQGKSISPEEGRLISEEVADRYESDLAFSSRLQTGIDYRVNPQISVGLGLQWEKEWTNIRMLDAVEEQTQGLHVRLGVTVNL